LPEQTAILRQLTNATDQKKIIFGNPNKFWVVFHSAEKRHPTEPKDEPPKHLFSCKSCWQRIWH